MDPRHDRRTTRPAAAQGTPQLPLRRPHRGGLLAWLSLGVSQRVVGWYVTHPPHFDSAFAQSIATAMKTLMVGMCFLATFTFAFIGLGLFLVFIRSLWPAEVESPS